MKRYFISSIFVSLILMQSAWYDLRLIWLGVFLILFYLVIGVAFMINDQGFADATHDVSDAEDSAHVVSGFGHPDSIRVILENDKLIVQVWCGENGWNSMGNGCNTRDYAQDVIDSIVEYTKLQQVPIAEAIDKLLERPDHTTHVIEHAFRARRLIDPRF